MCFTGEDYVETIKEMRPIKARKNLRCSYCGQFSIKPKDIYYGAVFKMDDIYRWRECMACHDIAEAIRQHEIGVEKCDPSESTPLNGDDISYWLDGHWGRWEYDAALKQIVAVTPERLLVLEAEKAEAEARRKREWAQHIKWKRAVISHRMGRMWA